MIINDALDLSLGSEGMKSLAGQAIEQRRFWKKSLRSSLQRDCGPQIGAPGGFQPNYPMHGTKERSEVCLTVARAPSPRVPLEDFGSQAPVVTLDQPLGRDFKQKP